MLKDFSIRYQKIRNESGSDFFLKKEKIIWFLVNKVHIHNRIKKIGRAKFSEKELLGNEDKMQKMKLTYIKAHRQPLSFPVVRSERPLGWCEGWLPALRRC